LKNNLQLLDCTLRDGGFINDWRFGKLTIQSVVSHLDSAGIDIIECGFLDSRAAYDENRTMFPNIPSIAKTLVKLPKQAKLAAMIDFGTFKRELLLPKNQSVLEGIRLIFRKDEIGEALKYAEYIKELGYSVFINPVTISAYRDIEILEMIEKINKILPSAVSIVDTYGLFFYSDIEKYVHLFDSNLDPSISLGYHSHNNLQMSNSLCISLITKNIGRNLIIDSSVSGMGKNAGNACTELICAYLSKNKLKNVSFESVLECAYADIAKFGSESRWGYNLDGLLSAVYDCSPNWIDFLMKKNISIHGIAVILDSLPFEKREVSFFNEKLAEEKYIEYLNTGC